MAAVTFCAAIYMTLAVTVERYIAVCRPHQYRSEGEGKNGGKFFQMCKNYYEENENVFNVIVIDIYKLTSTFLFVFLFFRILPITLYNYE